MEKLTQKSKEYLLHQIKKELLIAVHNLTINDFMYDTREDFDGEDVMVLGIMIRDQRMLTNQDIETLNRF